MLPDEPVCMGDTVNSATEQPARTDHAAATSQYGSATAATRQDVVEAVCTVWRPMNSHGAVTLMTETGQRTFHVVKYATSAIQSVLARTGSTEPVHVRLVALTARGDTWRATTVTANP